MFHPLASLFQYVLNWLRIRNRAMVYRLATKVENNNFEKKKKKKKKHSQKGLHATDLFFQILKNVSQSDAR